MTVDFEGRVAAINAELATLERDLENAALDAAEGKRGNDFETLQKRQNALKVELAALQAASRAASRRAQAKADDAVRVNLESAIAELDPAAAQVDNALAALLTALEALGQRRHELLAAISEARGRLRNLAPQALDLADGELTERVVVDLLGWGLFGVGLHEVEIRAARDQCGNAADAKKLVAARQAAVARLMQRARELGASRLAALTTPDAA